MYRIEAFVIVDLKSVKLNKPEICKSYVKFLDFRIIALLGAHQNQNRRGHHDEKQESHLQEIFLIPENAK